MTRALSLLVSLVAHPLPGATKPRAAVCTVPIADLLTQKLSPLHQQYASLPLSERQPATLCCRATQLLFNERVTILTQKDEQSFVETSFWHAKRPSFQSPSARNNRFWTLTKNLTLWEKLPPQAQAIIPPGIEQQPSQEEIITLSLPWECKESHTRYSAGTQFLVKKEEKDHYQIQLYVPTTNKIVESSVSKNLCVLSKPRTDEEKRTLFVSTIQKWAQGIPDHIPYVLGGASILTTFKNPLFEEKKITIGKNTGTVFTRLECTSVPHAGVDCSGMIRLACKIAGIPLTATNSKSIAQSLTKLPPHAPLQNGDILFWKGHTAIVSNTQKGLLIEARGYEHNYGLLQEIPYYVELKGITTSGKLMEAYIKKKPIQRLDKEGHHREVITDLTILSLVPIKPSPDIQTSL